MNWKKKQNNFNKKKKKLKMTMKITSQSVQQKLLKNLQIMKFTLKCTGKT